MRNALPTTILCVAFLAAPQARAAPADLQAANKRLEEARKALANAVSRIEKDPPSNADLDAAAGAVTALKQAIDAGVHLEDQDLDYAKAVLNARKELRTHRDYVEQRRANVHIHNHRRAIDDVLAAMNERVKRTGAKDASAKDFDEARAAVAAVKKAVDLARPTGKQDAKFAAFLADTDANVEKQGKALDDRWTALALDKHKAALAESREALSSAMAAIPQGGTDAQFEAADKAAAALSKKVAEGEVFESRDKAYRAEAEKARSQLALAKKRMEELMSSAVLERLKSEIEPANKELTSALKNLRGRKATEDQLAEAKTAAIVVRKLVDKLQPQANRSKAFGQYVSDVKKTLVEVEVELQRRTLEAARADAMSALRNVEKRSVTDEQFDELKTALTVLEKTLETVHKRDPAISKQASDAAALVRDGRARMARRRGEVDVQRQKDKVVEARRTAETAVKQLQQAKIGDEELKGAEGAVKQVKELLDAGVAFTKKDLDYRQFDKQVRDRLKELTDRIAARKIALAASRGRARLIDLIAAAKEKLDGAKKPQSTDADVAAAEKSVDELTRVIEANAALEKQDKGYRAQAERARNELLRQTEALMFAKPAHALRRATGEALQVGGAELAKAAETTDVRKQAPHYEKAARRFKACVQETERRLKENPAMAQAVVLVDGQPSTPNDAIAKCAEAAKSAEQQQRQAMARIAFEDGPKKSFEAGKLALAKGQTREALPRFTDCIGSGRMAVIVYPELKERKFEVAGATMSTTEVIDQCLAQRKALQPKEQAPSKN
jgi:hypothetical protein